MKNVVVNGLVLAEDGRKMSKRLKNYPEVDYVFDKYGADALRLFLMNSAAIKAGELLFSEKGVEDVIKRYHLPLWNTYSFFVTYAKVDNWNPKEQDNNYKNPLDIWLQSYTEKLATDCDKALGEYDFQTAIRSLYDYIDNLTNWYVRRSRRRFWKSEDDMDKKQAYTALYNALITFCKAAAPIAPFLSEKIYFDFCESKFNRVFTLFPTHLNVKYAEKNVKFIMRNLFLPFQGVEGVYVTPHPPQAVPLVSLRLGHLRGKQLSTVF
jgi:isoleucyl-tRNA synthetase